MPVLEKILHQVQSLPPLPEAVERLLALSEDADTTVQELTKIVTADQSLTAQVLRITNSALFGRVRQVQTVSQAIMVLGTKGLRNLAVSIAVLGLGEAKAIKFPVAQEQFWRHGLAVACASKIMAEQLKYPQPEEAFIAGLLHDIGKLVLMGTFPEAYPELIAEAKTRKKALFILEKEQLGVTHLQAGAFLCQHWNIPDEIATVVGLYNQINTLDQDNKLHASVCIGAHLGKLSGIGDGGEMLLNLKVWQDILIQEGISSDTIIDLMSALPKAVHELESLFFNPKPLVSSEKEITAWLDLKPSAYKDFLKLTLAAHQVVLIPEIAPEIIPAVIFTDKNGAQLDGVSVQKVKPPIGAAYIDAEGLWKHISTLLKRSQEALKQ